LELNIRFEQKRLNRGKFQATKTMKKTFTILLCFVLAFALVGCGNSESVETNGVQNGEEYVISDDNQNGTQEENGDAFENGEDQTGENQNGDAFQNGEDQYQDADIDSTENNGVAQDEVQTENNDNRDNSEINVGEPLVEITITAWLVDFLHEFVGIEPHEILNDREFETTRINQDGSFTGTMQRAEQEVIIAEMRANLPETFNGLVGNPMTPHVRNVTETNDFRNVIVDVDRLAYENSGFEFAHMVIGMSVLLYQMFGGQEGHVTMQFRDVDNGNLISTYTFPN
jgi:hypothetical protein